MNRNLSGRVRVKKSVYQQIESLCEAVIANSEEYRQLLMSFYNPWLKAINFEERVVKYWAEDDGTSIHFYR